MTIKSFQSTIFELQKFWSKYGCCVIQPIDLEVGAGTLHHATIFGALGENSHKLAYVQPCRRPTDARYAKNPNRLGYYHQFQVLLKPSPDDPQQLYLNSLQKVGINIKKNDIRFIEDDWENPTVGAAGLGWEVWLNGMEISQFTYMQQVGGIECSVVPVEITYGLERIVSYIQNVNNIFDINWNGKEGKEKITYRDIFLNHEKQQSFYVLQYSNIDILIRNFNELEEISLLLSEKNLPIPAYENAIKASHCLNLLDARGVISSTERANYISRVRNMTKTACERYLDLQKT